MSARAAVLVAQGIEPTTIRSFVNIQSSRVQTSVKTTTPSLPPYLQNDLLKHGCKPKRPRSCPCLKGVASQSLALVRQQASVSNQQRTAQFQLAQYPNPPLLFVSQRAGERVPVE
uniref:(California timema) hypothetical protein n=1 Tax=Timema californicum TaxID=61474 RepID=A0A7R9P8S1_TIMCA|nr:unnamed protein product [Timema californicum]